MDVDEEVWGRVGDRRSERVGLCVGSWTVNHPDSVCRESDNFYRGRKTRSSSRDQGPGASRGTFGSGYTSSLSHN